MILVDLIAASLPLPRKLREPEHGGPSHVRLAPAFLQGDAGTCGLGSVILAGAKSTTGKCFSLRALVHDANQSASRVFQAFSLTPVQDLSFVPIAHADTRAWSRKHDEQRNSASGA